MVWDEGKIILVEIYFVVIDYFKGINLIEKIVKFFIIIR